MSLAQRASAEEFKFPTLQNQSCFRHTRFPALWRQLHVFASNSDWLVVLFPSVVIGQSNYFGFGFTTRNCKPFKSYLFSQSC